MLSIQKLIRRIVKGIIVASLVLGVAGAAVGSLFGQPQLGYMVGSALGAALFPPAGQDGPRLNDLKAQNSVYGAAIPIIYGTFRTAGNTIWSAPLVEHAHEQDNGSGGGGSTTYTYTCSFAMSLCEGPIAGVKRVWADGKLIYDSTTGVQSFKATGFKVYLGTEAQLPDPTMEVAKGVGNVPAYRGQAYWVFTDLELAKYGNRVPNLTFEIYTKGSNAGALLNFPPELNFPLAIASSGAFIWQIDYSHLRKIDPATNTTVGVYFGSGLASFTGSFLYYYQGYLWVRHVTATGTEVWKIDATTGQKLTTTNTSVLGYHGKQFISDGTYIYVLDGNNKVGRINITTGQLVDTVTIGAWGTNGNATNVALSGSHLYIACESSNSATSGIFVIDLLTFTVTHWQAGAALRGVIVDGDYLWTTGSDYSDPHGSDTPHLYKVDRTTGSVIQDISLYNGSVSDQLYSANIVDSGASLWLSSFGLPIMYRVNKLTYAVEALGVGKYFYSDTAAMSADGRSVYTIAVYSSRNAVLVGFDVVTGTITTEIEAVGARADFFNKIVVSPDAVWATDGAYPSDPSQFIVKFSLNSQPTTIYLSEIVADVSTRVGLLSSEVDVTQLTDTVLGYSIPTPMSARAAIDPLSQAYFFGSVDSDSKIKFVKRGANPVVSIPVTNALLEGK